MYPCLVGNLHIENLLFFYFEVIKIDKLSSVAGMLCIGFMFFYFDCFEKIELLLIALWILDLVCLKVRLLAKLPKRVLY